MYCYKELACRLRQLLAQKLHVRAVPHLQKKCSICASIFQRLWPSPLATSIVLFLLICRQQQRNNKDLDNYLVIQLYPQSLHEFCYFGLCSFSHTCSFRKSYSSEKSFSRLLVSGLSFWFCSPWFWALLLLVKIPWCDRPWSSPRSVSKVLGSLLPWAALRHRSLCHSKTSLTCVSRAVLNHSKSSQQQRPCSLIPFSENLPYLMASFFHAVTLHLFLLKYFLWRVQGFHVVPKNAAIPFFAFSASSPLLTLCFHSKKYLLTCHPGRTILWLRCKMVDVKSCSAFSHPVFSVVVVPALFQVHCLMFPKSSGLFIPSGKE